MIHTGHTLSFLIQTDPFFDDFQIKVSYSSLDISINSGSKCNIYTSKYNFGCLKTETSQILKIEAFVITKWLIKHCVFLLTRYILIIYDMLVVVSNKNLYTGVKAQVLFSGSLSRSFDVSQRTGQRRILASFVDKVYIMYKIYNILHVSSDHNYAIYMRSLQLTSPSFPDDITLLALHPSIISVLVDMCHQYSIKWRYEFNNTKCGVVTFGESKALHC